MKTGFEVRTSASKNAFVSCQYTFICRYEFHVAKHCISQGITKVGSKSWDTSFRVSRSNGVAKIIFEYFFTFLYKSRYLESSCCYTKRKCWWQWVSIEISYGILVDEWNKIFYDVVMLILHEEIIDSRSTELRPWRTPQKIVKSRRSHSQNNLMTWNHLSTNHYIAVDWWDIIVKVLAKLCCC